MTVANCSIVIKHVNTSAALYLACILIIKNPGAAFMPQTIFTENSVALSNPSIQKYLWWNSSYFKTTFDKTAGISDSFTSKIIIWKKIYKLIITQWSISHSISERNCRISVLDQKQWQELWSVSRQPNFTDQTEITWQPTLPQTNSTGLTRASEGWASA